MLDPCQIIARLCQVYGDNDRDQVFACGFRQFVVMDILEIDDLTIHGRSGGDAVSSEVCTALLLCKFIIAFIC